MGRVRVAKYKPLNLNKGRRPLIHSLQAWMILIRGFLAILPILALVLIFILPRTPHVLTYYERHGYYTECTYWGTTGKVEKLVPDTCPVFSMEGEELQFDLSSYMRSISSIFD